jgi:transposase
VVEVVITVEDYKEIRQRHLEGESQRQIAKQMGISRNTVAKYCKGEQVPWERKTAERESSVLTEDVVEFIEECLCSDEREGVKKQKHTAKRIYNRLVEEKGFTGGESTVRAKVKELKGTLPKVFVPLAFSPGEALQIDWGLSTIYLNGEKVTVNLFCARLCFSCAPIVYAYHRQNQESFLEAFVRVFNFFEGVTEKVIFDNAKVAVKDGFGEGMAYCSGAPRLLSSYTGGQYWRQSPLVGGVLRF